MTIVHTITADAVVDMIERCADGKVTKDEMIDWFDWHKAKAS